MSFFRASKFLLWFFRFRFSFFGKEVGNDGSYGVGDGEEEFG